MGSKKSVVVKVGGVERVKPVVEFGVEKPATRRSRASRYPWEEMKAAKEKDRPSFFVPGKKELKEMNGVYASARKHGLRVSIRIVEEGGVVGARVWREGLI